MSSTDSRLEDERNTIQIALSKYISDKFQCPESAGSVYISGESIVITICGEKPNLKNFWSGRFHSTYNVKILSSVAEITGEIQVNI
jgi:hypothetical protein